VAMQPDPLVSVIIPSYNHARYIATAVESVLAQTYSNIEVIVVDDGSSDDTEAVVTPFLRNERVRALFNRENRGQSSVIKQGLEMASGDFVSFLPSDDWYLPDKTRWEVGRFLSLPRD